jgi:hypothetical protein
VIVVSRGVLDFTLQFKKLPAVAFKAESNITAVLP